MSSPIDAPGLGSAGRSSQRRATTHGRDDETVVEWSMRESRASGRRIAARTRSGTTEQAEAADEEQEEEEEEEEAALVCSEDEGEEEGEEGEE